MARPLVSGRIRSDMPIRREFRKFYRRFWRNVIRPRILARDQNRCQRCGAKNYDIGYRDRHGFFHPAPVRKRRAAGKLIRIILDVAHLNHIPWDNRDENLKAFCKRCHFLHDLDHHHQSRAARKDLARPFCVH